MTSRALAVVLAVALCPVGLVGQRLTPLFLGVPSSSAVFDDNIVHDVRLRMNTQDWQTLKEHYLENTYFPADFTWRSHVVRNVGIRSRGTGSRSPVKPGLKVSFDHYVDDQAFLGLSSIVLRNNTQDASNMHERLSMQIFQRLGLPAPRESYARFYVNEEYLGLYTIVESIDADFLGRYFPETNGYLYSFDYPADAEPFYFEDRGSDPARYVPQPFEPENHESNPRSDVIVQMVQTVNQAGEAVFRSAADAFVDLAGVLRHVAVESFLVDDDGVLGNWGMNNIYMYRLRDSTRFSFLVWDKSDAFLAGPSGSIWHGVNDVPPDHQNRLVTRALAEPDLRAAYLETLAECVRLILEPAAESPSGWLQAEIERQYAQIRDAARLDTHKPYTNEQFEQAVQDLRGFADARGDVVRREVAEARTSR